MKTQDEQLAESLHLVAHAWRNELDRRLRPLGFSHSRWLLLLHLSRHDGCTHCELAQHMGIEAATLVKQVDHMEQEGLLKRCTSVKTVRLCLQLGRELSQPWAGKLDPSQLPKGSDRPWVSRSGDGLLVLKP